MNAVCEAQIKMRPEFAGAYLQHSKLFGFSTGCTFDYTLKSGDRIGLGVLFAHGEGNRDFDFDPTQNPNVLLDYYAPDYDLFRSIDLEFPIELDARTATTFQYILQTAYKKKLTEKIFIGAGLYGTFINKSYLAGPIDDFGFDLFGIPYVADIYIPFHIRYFDLGPLVLFNYQLNKAETKIPVGIETKTYLAVKQNWSYHLGITIDL